MWKMSLQKSKLSILVMKEIFGIFRRQSENSQLALLTWETQARTEWTLSNNNKNYDNKKCALIEIKDVD